MSYVLFSANVEKSKIPIEHEIIRYNTQQTRENTKKTNCYFVPKKRTKPGHCSKNEGIREMKNAGKHMDYLSSVRKQRKNKNKSPK